MCRTPTLTRRGPASSLQNCQTTRLTPRRLARVLKVKGMRDVSPGKRLFVIENDGEPAPKETLQRIAAIARQLLAENELPGEFAVFDSGLLSLDVRATERSFFHDGIVFAALDAVNDPSKNPTLSNIPIDRPPTPD